MARGVKIELEHAAAGQLSLVASPMRFSGTPLEYRLAPPLLGEHTDEVLKGLLSKNDAEIAKLMAKPELIAAWDKQGAVPMKMSPAEFDDFLRKDIKKWADVVKTANIKAQ